MSEKIKRRSREFKQNNGLDGLVQEMQTNMGKFSDMIKSCAEETKKIATPKEKKNVTIGELACGMSMTDDGRVFIQFPSQGDAERYFNAPPTYTASDIQEAIKEGHQKGSDDKDTEWRNKPWYKRLFI